jgi:stage II sporulation protein D
MEAAVHRTRWQLLGLLAAALAAALAAPGDGDRPGAVLQWRAAAAADPWPPVRVCLNPPGGAALTISSDRPVRIVQAADGTDLLPPRPLPETRVSAHGGRLVIGDRALETDEAALIPDEGREIWVGASAHRGRILLSARGERAVAVSLVPLETYVACVVDSEMPIEFGEEARKAQAIVARTYALYQMERAGPGSLFDVYADVRSQKYLGVRYRGADGRVLSGLTPQAAAAAAATRGMVCVEPGGDAHRTGPASAREERVPDVRERAAPRLFCTYYSAACGGRTSPGRAFFDDASPRLASVECPYCRDAPLYRWERRLPRATVEQALGPRLGQPALVRTLTSRAEPDGSPPRFTARAAGAAPIVLTGREIRALLPSGTLPSPRFSLEYAGEEYVVCGRGHGHGAGLCQWGARGMARQGFNGLQILAHYYPGSRVVILDPR